VVLKAFLDVLGKIPNFNKRFYKKIFKNVEKIKRTLKNVKTWQE